MTDIYKWSTTASSNASADSDIDASEGMSPGLVNDDIRAMMARLAEFRDDISGTITAGGSANALTATANSSFTAYADGRIICLIAANTSTSTATLNVNSIGAKNIYYVNSASVTSLSAGAIISGGLYWFQYNEALNSGAGGWMLLNPSVVSTFHTTATISAETSGTQTITLNPAAGIIVSDSTTGLIDPTSDSNYGVSLAFGGKAVFSRNTATPVYVRRGTDGTLIDFMTNLSSRGSISVSGTTVSYNSFSGSHWSQLSDGSKPDIPRGTIVETINEMCEWMGKDNDQLVKFKVSDTAGSCSVYGVFSGWYVADEGEAPSTNDAHITALGAFLVRIDASEIVSVGDLIESAGNGCGRVQGDGLFKASTVAKVTATTRVETYDDGSYIVPCTLHCG